MHPIVGPPVCACRNIPEPLPGTTGRVLYSITARCGYGFGCCHIPSLPPAKGGFFPQATCWKVLYVGERESSSHQSPQRRRR